MTTGNRYMLQWEEHSSHLSTRLGQLLEQQVLVDVTLMCNTHSLRVHRAVLASCSPYFENLLQKIAERQLVQHPLIVLKDMQFSVLKCIIEFMYTGATNVVEDDLGPLLQASRFFQVKGLSSMSKEELGLPPSQPSKVNGETGKMATDKGRLAATPGIPTKKRAVATPGSAKTATPVPTTGNLTPVRPAASTVVKKPPGIGLSESAQLLLSLSGETDAVPISKPATTVATVPVSKPSTSVAVPKMTTPVGQSTPKANPVLSPTSADRKRGRPLKQTSNLIFTEKVVSPTESAIRIEAEASRNALKTLQKEISEKHTEAAAATASLVMVGKRVSTPQTGATSPTKKLVSIPKKTGAAEQQKTIIAEGTSGTTNVMTLQIQGGDGNQAQLLEALKAANFPTDMPILLDSGDGNYVTVDNETLMNIVNGGVLQVASDESAADSGKPEAETTEEEAEEQPQIGQVVQYVDENGQLVEGVLAMVQEGEEGTTVAVTPSGQVLQIQATDEGYQIVQEGNSETIISGSEEGLISADLQSMPATETAETPISSDISNQEFIISGDITEDGSNKRPADNADESESTEAKKIRL